MVLRITIPDGCVARYFGTAPERGRRLMGINIQATAGVREKPFGRGTERYPITVQPLVCLHYVKPGVWDVIVEPQYQHAAEQWLKALIWQYEFANRPRKRVRRTKPKNIVTHMIKVDNG